MPTQGSGGAPTERTALSVAARAELFEQIIDRSPVGVLLLDEAGAVVFANQTAQVICGSGDHDTTSAWPRAIDQGERFCHALAVDKEALTAVIRGGQTIIARRFPALADGRAVRELKVDLSPLWREADGGPFALAVITDVSETARLTAEVLEREQRYQEFFDFLPLTAFETDSELRLTTISHRALEQFGYQREDIERGLSLLDLLAPEDVALARETIPWRIKGEISSGIEYTAVRKNGERFAALVYSDPLVQGEVFLGLRGVLVDITERKQAEAERRRLVDQLQMAQKVESLGRLAGGVAHDFNNLLSPIIGYAEVIKETLGSSHPLYDDVREIHRAAKSAKELTQQLLAFGRKQMLNVKPMSLNSVVVGLQKMLIRLIRENIELVFDLDAALGTTNADALQIQQIVINLALNAADAMPDGGRMRIETANVVLDEAFAASHSGTRPGRYVLLVVSDTGVGMNDETIGNIFEPFFTTKEKGRGTGLGLATVYGIVKQHAGNIWVTSSPGGGAVFRVYLPRLDEGEVEARLPSQVPDLSRGEETVLVVEDDEMVRKLAGRLLRQRGYFVLLASNPDEAEQLSAQQEGPIELLLTNVVLPKLDGRQLYESLRKRHPGLKVIYLAGYTGSKLERRIIDNDEAPVLAKPFAVEALHRVVREVLDSGKGAAGG